MYQMLFKNRFIALLFVAMTVLGVRTLVGTEEKGGTLTRAMAQIEADTQALRDRAQHFQRSGPETATPSAVVIPGPVVATGFMPDEELINDAQGYDPVAKSAEPLSADAVVIDGSPDIVIPDDEGGN